MMKLIKPVPANTEKKKKKCVWEIECGKKKTGAIINGPCED